MALGLELKHLIENRLKEFLNSTEPDPLNLRSVAANLNALPLLLDIGGCYAIRPGGEIVTFAWDDEKNFEIEHDRRIRNIALFQGSKKYPELNELIPARSAHDLDCSHCKGTGRNPVYEQLGIEGGANSPILCWCGGLGWVPSEKSPD